MRVWIDISIPVLLFFTRSSSATIWLTLNDEAILNALTDSPNITSPKFICDQINGLGERSKEICYHNPAIMSAIGIGNRRTLEHLEKVFETEKLSKNLLIYKSLFSFRIDDSNKREIIYLASIRSSAITHELALVCSDGLSEDLCPCYRPPLDTDPEIQSALSSTPLVLDQGCPYALAYAQRITLDLILNDPDITVDIRNMIKEHVIAAVKSVEAGWVDPEEEWERKLRELEQSQKQLGQVGKNGYGARIEHGEF